MDRETLESRVEKGIIFLRTRESEETQTPEGMRKVRPELKGWPTRINLEILDLSEPYECIIGQIYGSFIAGLYRLGLSMRESEALGFWINPIGMRHYPDLTEAWRERLSAMPEVREAKKP